MGANLFYMPHGISVDHENNIWVTDVGLHQVSWEKKRRETRNWREKTKWLPDFKRYLIIKTVLQIGKSIILIMEEKSTFLAYILSKTWKYRLFINHKAHIWKLAVKSKKQNGGWKIIFFRWWCSRGTVLLLLLY